jgi:hypothetical protein
MNKTNDIRGVEEITTAVSGHLLETIPMRQVDNADKLPSVEESHTTYANHFPEEMPARPGPPPAASAPWKQRLRGFWTFSLSSYSIIHTPSGAARARHIAMVTILLLRTGMSALSILSAVVKGNIAGIVIYSLLAILGLWFTATCLAIIGDAEGDKPLKGFMVVSYIQRLPLRLRTHVLIMTS